MAHSFCRMVSQPRLSLFLSPLPLSFTVQGGNQAADGVLVLSDLQSSLRSFLASKAPAKASPSTPSTQVLGGGLSPWEGIQLAPQFAEVPPPPAAAVKTDAATAAAAAAAVEAAEQVDSTEEMETVPAAGAGGFGNLPLEFLQDVQTALESLGFDLTSADAMQQLAGDPSLVDKLLPLLTACGASPAVVTERLRQWQQAMQEQMEVERQLKAKKQRPVWRCAACGRYGCPVAPYIESYREVDA